MALESTRKQTPQYFKEIGSKTSYTEKELRFGLTAQNIRVITMMGKNKVS